MRMRAKVRYYLVLVLSAVFSVSIFSLVGHLALIGVQPADPVESYFVSCGFGSLGFLVFIITFLATKKGLESGDSMSSEEENK